MRHLTLLPGEGSTTPAGSSAPADLYPVLPLEGLPPVTGAPIFPDDPDPAPPPLPDPEPRLLADLEQLDLLLDGLTGDELRRTALSVYTDSEGTVRARRQQLRPV